MSIKKFAIFGCGGIANVHAEAVLSLDDALLVGCADVVKENAPIYLTMNMDTTAKWFEDVLGWYSNIVERDVDGNGGTDYVKDNQLLTEDPWKTFFMIPQEFQDSTLLNVSMSVSGEDLPLLSIPLAEVHSEGNRGWSPGKQYVYRISYKR